MFPPSDGSSRPRSTRASQSGRGQSELVGVTLLLLIVVLGSTVVALTGVQALDDNKQTVAVSQAEKSLQEFDSRSSDVTLGFDGEASQVAELQRGDGDGAYELERESWIRVQIRDTSNGTVQKKVVNKTTMGSVVYRNDGTTLAFEGGGVWRSDDGGSTMVSPPEFHFRDGTLTLPIVSVSGDRSPNGRVRVTRDGPPERKFPDESRNLTNRLRDGKVVVTVQSDYYRAWGRYFEENSNAYVYYDDGANQVNAVFLVLPGWGSLRSGIIATSGAGELLLKGTGAYIDSYNSSIGDYDATVGKNGSVEAVGNITLTGDSNISGDPKSGDVLELDSSSAKIDGDVYWTNDFINSGTVTGTDTQIDGIAAVEPIDGFVDVSVEVIREESDNDATSTIQDEQLDIDGSSAELGAGSYYLENLYLEGEKLTLNTTDGDIYIGVRDWVNLERDGGVASNITVVGNNTVRVFVQSEATTTVSVTGEGNREVNLNVGKGSTVYVPGDRSPQLRLYAPQSFESTIAGSNSDHAIFTGVIYAPAGVDGNSSVYTKQSDVYGQILTGNLTIGQNGAVHYDLALLGTPLPRSPTLARLEFMHVAIHKAEIKDQ